MAMPTQLARAKRTRRRIKSQLRIVLEELPAIDARWLSRKKLFPKDWSTRRLDFHIFNPIIDWLVLGPYIAEVIFTTGQKQIIPIKWLRISGMCQGVRPIFECVSCGRRRFKLFYYQGRLSCYRCTNRLGVPYASQQVSRKGRKYLQSQRLRRFLGEYPGCTTIHKPLFLHRKTYNRLLARLRRIEGQASNRGYNSKSINHGSLKPNNMYRVQLAAVANA